MQVGSVCVRPISQNEDMHRQGYICPRSMGSATVEGNGRFNRFVRVLEVLMGHSSGPMDHVYQKSGSFVSVKIEPLSIMV